MFSLDPARGRDRIIIRDRALAVSGAPCFLRGPHFLTERGRTKRETGGIMFRALLWRPPALLAGTALAALLTLRITVAAWVYNQAPVNACAALLVPWVFDTALTAVLLIVTVAGCCWLTRRTRRREREQARVEHLAEVGLLAGGLAHEIRNTLNAMRSQIALLRKQLSPEKESAWQRTDQLECAVVEMEELVGEFLAFARPAKDQMEEVDLPALIGGVLDFVALDLEQSRVRAVTDLASDLLPVCGDAGKLKRALLNLVINARQAMPDGGTLTVRARPVGRASIVLEVCDTGYGIPQEDRPRIFQTFFSTRPGGTGLGLAVVRRTVEDLGGRITFESQVGRGTTFRISLPTAERRRVTLERHAYSHRDAGVGV
jgi:signal transduction histidine kinase